MTNEGHIDVGHQDSGPILKKLAKEPKGQVSQLNYKQMEVVCQDNFLSHNYYYIDNFQELDMGCNTSI